MKGFFIEIKNSVYNPPFYKEVLNQPYHKAVKYFSSVVLLASLIILIASAIHLVLEINITNWPLLISSVIGLFSFFIVIFLTLYIETFVKTLISGFIIFLIFLLLRKRMSYKKAHIISLYATTLGMIIGSVEIFFGLTFDINSFLGTNSYLFMISFSILIFLINYRKKPPSFT